MQIIIFIAAVTNIYIYTVYKVYIIKTSRGLSKCEPLTLSIKMNVEIASCQEVELTLSIKKKIMQGLMKHDKAELSLTAGEL